MRVALAIVASMPILILSSDVDAFPGSPRQIHEAFIVLVAPGCGRGVPRTREGGCAVAGSKQKVGKPTFGPNGMECPPGARLSGSGRNCIR
jgi:hypothetical protein